MSRLHLLNRGVSTAFYGIEFVISILILGIFSYFLAVLARRDNTTIPNWQKSVEGLSGAAALYTLLAIVFTCFLGGLTFFAFIAVVFNVVFCAAMVAIAILTKAGAKSCPSRRDDSPIGTGHRTACQLEKVVFAVSIINAILFLVSVAFQVALARSHKREKRFGPSPANNYTSGSGKRRPWERKKKGTNLSSGAEMGGLGTIPIDPKHDDRRSDITGTTAPVNDVTYGGPVTKYSQAPVQHTTGYATSYPPQTSGVAPSSTGASELNGSHAGTMTSTYAQQNTNPYELQGAGYAR